MCLSHYKILIRGAGEVASAIAHKLSASRFQVCMTDITKPLAVSRGVCFCEVMYEGEKTIDGVTAKLVSSSDEIDKTWQAGKIAVMIDPQASIKDSLKPDIIIDAIMAKKDTGTKITDAQLVIGMGIGFHVGKNAHLIVETSNSENMGRVLYKGEAEPNDGVPVEINGLTQERVLRHPQGGLFKEVKLVGDTVKAGDIIGTVNGSPVKSEIDGVVRALIRDNTNVAPMIKLGEIDPRGESWMCYAIRPRMRAIAGGVLEAILSRINI
jgi:xanthine dehydrogenase accessory factor